MTIKSHKSTEAKNKKVQSHVPASTHKAAKDPALASKSSTAVSKAAQLKKKSKSVKVGK